MPAKRTSREEREAPRFDRIVRIEGRSPVLPSLGGLYGCNSHPDTGGWKENRVAILFAGNLEAPYQNLEIPFFGRPLRPSPRAILQEFGPFFCGRNPPILTPFLTSDIVGAVQARLSVRTAILREDRRILLVEQNLIHIRIIGRITHAVVPPPIALLRLKLAPSKIAAYVVRRRRTDITGGPFDAQPQIDGFLRKARPRAQPQDGENKNKMQFLHNFHCLY